MPMEAGLYSIEEVSSVEVMGVYGSGMFEVLSRASAKAGIVPYKRENVAARNVAVKMKKRYEYFFIKPSPGIDYGKTVSDRF